MIVVLLGYFKYIDNVFYYILDEEKCKQFVEDLNELEIIKENIRIKVIGESGSEKVVLFKSEFELKGYVNVGLGS